MCIGAKPQGLFEKDKAMRLYRMIFQGRQVGAIGSMHTCAETVEAEDQQAAELKLYDTHEHISIKYWSEWTGKERTAGSVIEV